MRPSGSSPGTKKNSTVALESDAQFWQCILGFTATCVTTDGLGTENTAFVTKTVVPISKTRTKPQIPL